MRHIILDKSSVYKSISFSFKRIYKCILQLTSLTLIRKVCIVRILLGIPVSLDLQTLGYPGSQCILIVHYGHLNILFWWKKSRIVRYLQVWQNLYYDFHKIGWLKIVERSIIMSCVDQFCRRKLDLAHQAKGQLISKCLFGVINSSKNRIWKF